MYRNLDDILNQDGAKKILKGIVLKKRIHHALLFTGPDGVGKKTTAYIFAKILNCIDLSPDSMPCEKCHSCTLFNSFFFTHSDFKIFSDIQNPLIVNRRFLLNSAQFSNRQIKENQDLHKIYSNSIKDLWEAGFLLNPSTLPEGKEIYDIFHRNKDMLFKSPSDPFPDTQYFSDRLEKLIKSDGQENTLAFNLARKLYTLHFSTTFFRSIKTDLLRKEFVEEINFKPFELERKVFIIDEFEKVSPNSENIILKTLEEPPENSILILITSKKQALIPTILSRCMEIEFKELPLEMIMSSLKKFRKKDEEDARLLSSVSRGSLGLALVSDAGEIKDLQKDILLILDYFSSSPSVTIEDCLSALFSADSDLNERRNQVKNRFNIFNQMIRDILLLKLLPDSEELVHINRKNDLNQLKESFSEKGLVQLGDLAEEAVSNVDMNADIATTLESFLIKGKNIFKGQENRR